MTYWIGIDGGGTKTEGVLTDTQGTVLARSVVGATNPHDVTLPVSADRMADLVRMLLSNVGLPEDALEETAIFGGIAGGMLYREALEEALRDRLPPIGRLAVQSDIHILLAGELPCGDGACIICGTGSVCFLRCGRELIRIGGWGYLLDSSGSGYDIGRDALEAVLRAHDGRGRSTALTQLVTAHVGGEVSAMLADIYHGGKPYIASCAPLVFQAATDGDTVAADILRCNAHALAEYVETAWRQLVERTAPPTDFPVVFSGGISRGQSKVLVPLIVEQLSPSIPARLMVAQSPPVLGAVLEAARLSVADARTEGKSPTEQENTVTPCAFSDFESVSERFSESYATYL